LAAEPVWTIWRKEKLLALIFVENTLIYPLEFMFSGGTRRRTAVEWYSRITSTKSPSFCMTTFNASHTNLTVVLPQSYDRRYYVSRRTLAPPPLWLRS
jgi:hypothetical protein